MFLYGIHHYHELWLYATGTFIHTWLHGRYMLDIRWLYCMHGSMCACIAWLHGRYKIDRWLHCMRAFLDVPSMGYFMFCHAWVLPGRFPRRNMNLFNPRSASKGRYFSASVARCALVHNNYNLPACRCGLLRTPSNQTAHTACIYHHVHPSISPSSAWQLYLCTSVRQLRRRPFHRELPLNEIAERCVM